MKIKKLSYLYQIEVKDHLREYISYKQEGVSIVWLDHDAG